jgi:hypothetical protein
MRTRSPEGPFGLRRLGISSRRTPDRSWRPPRRPQSPEIGSGDPQVPEAHAGCAKQVDPFVDGHPGAGSHSGVSARPSSRNRSPAVARFKIFGGFPIVRRCHEVLAASPAIQAPRGRHSPPPGPPGLVECRAPRRATGTSSRCEFAPGTRRVVLNYKTHQRSEELRPYPLQCVVRSGFESTGGAGMPGRDYVWG